MEKSEAYKEAGVMVCDSCGEALEDCDNCREIFRENDEIYCEEISECNCKHYCKKCGGNI